MLAATRRDCLLLMQRALALGGMATLQACAGGQQPTLTGSLPADTPKDGTPAAATTPRRATKVALIVPLTGTGATALIGRSLRQAAELALAERDTPPVQLVVKDDRGTPEGARAAADEALKEGVQIILGPLFAKSVQAVAPLARAANVPVVAFSNDRQVAGNGVYLLGFQPGPEVQRVVSYAAQQGRKRFVALISEDAFGRLAQASFKDAVTRAQGTIVALETYPMAANSVLEPLRKVATVIEATQAEAPIDAFFLPGGQDHMELVARLLPQANIDLQAIKILGTGGLDYPNAGRDQSLVGAWFPAPNPAGWADFSQKFAKSYAAAPPRISALAFDGISLAIALAATPGPDAFSAAQVTRSTGFTGVDGNFRLAADGGCERPLAILEVQKFGASIVDPATAQATTPGAFSAMPAKSTTN